MAAPVIRAEHDQLTSIANTFGRHAELTRDKLQRLRKLQDTLQGGDWVGSAAQAFYAEMNSEVMPSLNRLSRALEQAADTAHQVSRIMEQAGEDAAALWRFLDFSGAGIPGAAGPALAFAPGPGGPGWASKKVADRDALVDKWEAQLDPKLQEFLETAAGTELRGTALRTNLYTLANGGWEISQGDETDVSWGKITFGPNASAQEQVHAIARAVAEEGYAARHGPRLDPTTMNKGEYVGPAADRQLDVAAERIFAEYEMLGDFKAEGSLTGGGPAVPFVPVLPPTAEADRKAFEALGDPDTRLIKGITEEEAVDEMRRLLRTPATTRYAQDLAAKNWDEMNIELGE